MIALICAFALALLQGVAVPTNDGWVTDQAGLLTPEQERSLEALAESYRAGTAHEIALLTVPDLGGQPIERFALEVGRAWKIGSKESDNGALLLVSKGDRKMRIEVGRGLEGELTDSISGRIIREHIAPRFKAGDYYGGLRAGMEAMHAAIGGQYAPPQPTRRQVPAPVGAIAMLLVLFVIIGLARSGRRARVHGMPPVWIAPMLGGGRRSSGLGGGGFGGGGFGGFGGGGGFRGGGASGGW